jgi:hypothetical protein
MDHIASLALDNFGNLFACGWTSSSDFPVAAFVTKLSGDGSRIRYRRRKNLRFRSFLIY